MCPTCLRVGRFQSCYIFILFHFQLSTSSQSLRASLMFLNYIDGIVFNAYFFSSFFLMLKCGLRRGADSLIEQTV